jgi:hypothetical protein
METLPKPDLGPTLIRCGRLLALRSGEMRIESTGAVSELWAQKDRPERT